MLFYIILHGEVNGLLEFVETNSRIIFKYRKYIDFMNHKREKAIITNILEFFGIFRVTQEDPL